MNVRAIAKGYYGRLHTPGDPFVIPDEPARAIRKEDDEATKAAAVNGKIPVAFASSWMAPEAGKAAPAAGKPKAGKAAPAAGKPKAGKAAPVPAPARPDGGPTGNQEVI